MGFGGRMFLLQAILAVTFVLGTLIRVLIDRTRPEGVSQRNLKPAWLFGRPLDFSKPEKALEVSRRYMLICGTMTVAMGMVALYAWQIVWGYGTVWAMLTVRSWLSARKARLLIEKHSQDTNAPSVQGISGGSASP